MCVSDTDIYTVNKSGTLLKTNYSSGNYEVSTIGPEKSFNEIWFIEYMDRALWTVEKGVLYVVDPTDGGFIQLTSNWKGTLVFTAYKDYLYSIDSRGYLWKTSTILDGVKMYDKMKDLIYLIFFIVQYLQIFFSFLRFLQFL